MRDQRRLPTGSTAVAFTAAAAGILVAGLWAGLAQLGLATYPPFDLADLLIRASPGGLATWAIETFGHTAKRLLLAGGVLLWVAAWPALTLAVGRDRERPGMITAAISFAAGFGLAWWDGAQGGQLAWLVITLGLPAALGGLLLDRWLAGLKALDAERTREASDHWIDQPGDYGRRELLGRIALLTLGLGLGGVAIGRALSWLSGPETPTEAGEPLAAVAASPEPSVATPATSGFIAPDGVPPRYTDNAAFYRVDISTRAPNINQDSWSLTVAGQVDREVVLAWQDLLAMPAVTQDGTLMCISFTYDSGLISTTHWTGVPLRDVLQRAGIGDGVARLVCHGAGGYSDSIPLAKALDPRTILAYGMDGTTLPRNHGFPCRLYIPDLYGEKNVKWLERIELIDADYRGYWQERGWTNDATIQIISTIETPRGTVTPGADGIVPLGGIAFAGSRGIRLVEVQIDDGPWQPAEIEPYQPELVWQRWRYDWRPAAGRYRVTARATDGTGALQIAAETDPHPDGMTGYQTVRLEVA